MKRSSKEAILTLMPPALIILCSMIIAVCWVFTVPILQSPDEDSHADYVFSLYSKKRLIQNREAPLAACSHPYLQYLFEVTDGQAIKCGNYIQLPLHYGEKEFFNKLDKQAPKDREVKYLDKNPVMVAVSPVGYYALVATVLNIISFLNRDLSFLFFSARMISVFLLGIGLFFSYKTMRELPLSKLKANLVLAAIGFFPLTSFVNSYIQPDSLSFCLLSISFYFCLKLKNSLNIKLSNLLLLGLSLALLLVTKYQFFLCAAVPILLLLVSKLKINRSPVSSYIFSLGILLISCLITGAIQLWVSWGNQLPPRDAHHWHWLPVISSFKEAYTGGLTKFCEYAWHTLNIASYFVYNKDGHVFQSFWGAFGHNFSVPLIMFSPDINNALRQIISLLTSAIIVFTLITLFRIFLTIIKLIRKKHVWLALCLIASNPLANSYFLFIIIISTVYIIFFPSFRGQGRHWFPLILPIFLNAAIFAPRVIPSVRLRKIIFFSISIGWLAYSIIGNYFALNCIHKKYYRQQKTELINFKDLKFSSRKVPCTVLSEEYLERYPSFTIHPFHDLNSLVMPEGSDFFLLGWSNPSQAKPSSIFLVLDNSKAYPATYGPSSEWEKGKEFGLFPGCNFDELIPAKDLPPGEHTVSLKVLLQDKHTFCNTGNDIKVTVQKDFKL